MLSEDTISISVSGVNPTPSAPYKVCHMLYVPNCGRYPSTELSVYITTIVSYVYFSAQYGCHTLKIVKLELQISTLFNIVLFSLSVMVKSHYTLLQILNSIKFCENLNDLCELKSRT